MLFTEEKLRNQRGSGVLMVLWFLVAGIIYYVVGPFLLFWALAGHVSPFVPQDPANPGMPNFVSMTWYGLGLLIVDALIWLLRERGAAGAVLQLTHTFTCALGSVLFFTGCIGRIDPAKGFALKRRHPTHL